MIKELELLSSQTVKKIAKTNLEYFKQILDVIELPLSIQVSYLQI